MNDCEWWCDRELTISKFTFWIKCIHFKIYWPRWTGLCKLTSINLSRLSGSVPDSIQLLTFVRCLGISTTYLFSKLNYCFSYNNNNNNNNNLNIPFVKDPASHVDRYLCLPLIFINKLMSSLFFANLYKFLKIYYFFQLSVFLASMVHIFPVCSSMSSIHFVVSLFGLLDQ